MQLWILFRKRYLFSPCTKQIEAGNTLKASKDVIYKFTAFTKVITLLAMNRPSKHLEIVLTLLNSSCSRNLGQDNWKRPLCLKLISRLITEDYSFQLAITSCQNGAFQHSWFSQLTSQFSFFWKWKFLQWKFEFRSGCGNTAQQKKQLKRDQLTVKFI